MTESANHLLLRDIGLLLLLFCFASYKKQNLFAKSKKSKTKKCNISQSKIKKSDVVCVALRSPMPSHFNGELIHLSSLI